MLIHSTNSTFHTSFVVSWGWKLAVNWLKLQRAVNIGVSWLQHLHKKSPNHRFPPTCQIPSTAACILGDITLESTGNNSWITLKSRPIQLGLDWIIQQQWDNNIPLCYEDTSRSRWNQSSVTVWPLTASESVVQGKIVKEIKVPAVDRQRWQKCPLTEVKNRILMFDALFGSRSEDCSILSII